MLLSCLILSQVNDKDVCLGLVSASHDQHVGKILAREDEARVAETARTADIVSSYTQGKKRKGKKRREERKGEEKTLSHNQLIVCCILPVRIQ